MLRGLEFSNPEFQNIGARNIWVSGFGRKIIVDGRAKNIQRFSQAVRFGKIRNIELLFAFGLFFRGCDWPIGLGFGIGNHRQFRIDGF